MFTHRRRVQLKKNVSAFLDHTLLKPEAQEKDILKLCSEARQHSLFAVCVNPLWLPTAVQALTGCATLPITVVGFPLGAVPSSTKAFETSQAFEAGAQEIDMVMDIGSFKSGDFLRVQKDIEAVRKACNGKTLKVIIETGLLSPSEITQASKICVEAGASFVKTSTGFSGGGATIEAVQRIRQAVGPSLGVKASGGIRDFLSLRAMVEAGATRVGSSASVAILKEAGDACAI